MIQFLLFASSCCILLSNAYLHHSHHHHQVLRSSTKLYKQPPIKSGKGFGKTPVVTDTNTEITQTPDNASKDNENDVPSIDLKTTALASDEDKILNTKMFKSAKMRSEERLDEKIQRLKEEQDLLDSDPSVGAVPELVANRMITRIAAFFGIPVFGGLAIFVGAFFVSRKYDLVIPPMVMAYVTQIPFLIGFLGISYAILSSSWDDEPGSLLGISEFKLNVKRIQDGFGRERDTARLKDEIEKESERLGRMIPILIKLHTHSFLQMNLGGFSTDSSRIYLNVYDLSEQNDMLYPLGLGTYHSGVQIGREEYTFASGSGIFTHSPRGAGGAKFREAIDMGTYSGGSKAVDAIIRDLRKEFVRQLNGREIPGYVNRLAFIGSIFSCLLPNDMNQAPVQDGSGGGSTSGGVYGSSGQARNRFPAPGPNKFSGKGMKLGGN